MRRLKKYACAGLAALLALAALLPCAAAETERYSVMDTAIQRTVHVRDYGAVPDTGAPQGDAILAALKDAAGMGEGTRVLFDAGVYHVNAPHVIEEPNRNPSLENQALSHFYLPGARGLVIDGNGATLLFEDCFAGAFRFVGCDGVSVVNMTIDYLQTPWTQGEVVSVSPSDGSFVYRAGEDANDLLADPRMGAALKSENPWSRVFGMVMDKDNPVLLKKSAEDVFLISGYEKLGGKLYRVSVLEPRCLNPNFIDAGDKVTLNNRGMSGSAISVFQSRNVYIRDVTVYASPDCGIIGSYGKGELVADSFRLMRRPGSGRWLSSNADGIHFQGFEGKITVENCLFEGMSDDGINFYQIPVTVDEVIGKSELKVTHWSRLPQAGEMITLFNPVEGRALGRAQVVSSSAAAAGGGGVTITLDREIPVLTAGEPSKSTIIYIDAMAFDGSVIRNNIFREFRGRGVISRTSNTAIEGNQFIRISSNPIDIQNYDYREGLFASGMTIRNNSVDGSAYMEKFKYGGKGAQFIIQVTTSGGGQSKTTGHTNILIEGNTILNSTSRYAIFAANTDGLTIRGNTIKTARSAGWFLGKNCWGDTQLVPLPGAVRVERCKNASVQGNVIEEARWNAFRFISWDIASGRVSMRNNHIKWGWLHLF